MMISPTKTTKKQSSLETANEMFKAAFAMKRTRFAEKFPHLSSEDLDKMTALYFRKINEVSK